MLAFIYLIIFIYALSFFGYILGYTLRAVAFFMRMLSRFFARKENEEDVRPDGKHFKNSAKEVLVPPSDLGQELTYEQVEKQAIDVISDVLTYNEVIYDKLAYDGDAIYSIPDALSITEKEYESEYNTKYWNAAFESALSQTFDGAKVKSFGVGVYSLSV